MEQATLNGETDGKRAMAIYEQRLHQLIETEENIGKMVIIDLNSGDYEFDADELGASRRLRERRPEGNLFGIRIGYETAYSLGGGQLKRIKR